MRNPLITLSVTAAVCLSCSTAPHYERLDAENHPRIIIDGREFALMKEDIVRGDNPILLRAHAQTMELSDKHGLSPAPLVYQKDASGKRLLAVSREAMTRIVSAAYAYRFTGDEAYLKHAENDINTVCAFKDWNPSHYLDCAEMATAVAIGYDWLYGQLQDSTRTNVVKALKEKAFATSASEESKTYCKWKTVASNWNQVCNTGLTVAALAIFEDNPQWSREFIESNIESNRKAMEGIYPPEGAYPEGPVYWVYGNMYQTLMLAVLESALGSDFGLSEVEGFSRTGLFEAFMDGNTDRLFNYGDNQAQRIPMYPLWYLADKFDCPQILYREKTVMFRRPYVHIECERFLPIYMKYIWRIDPKTIDEPSEKLLFSQGSTPSAIVRTGWNDNDTYLGVKGGSPGFSHSHMDAGEFVYESDSVRWASDLSRQEYAELENPCKALGGDLWDFSQNSVRWRLFRYTTAQHNVLTVNGHNQRVDGKAVMCRTFDTPAFRGAEFDLSEIYSTDLEYAFRKVGLVDGNFLEVKDSVCAAADAPAHIRWTLVTQSEPEITPDGILLSANGVKSLLKAEGVPVSYHIYPSDVRTIDAALEYFDQPVQEKICGFEFDLPAGCAKQVTTTLTKLQIQTRPTFNCCSVSLEPEIQDVMLEYRKIGDKWTPVPAFRGSLTGLEEDTEYEVRFVKNGTVIAGKSFETWADDVKIGRTVEIDPEKYSAPFIINEKGSPDGWIRYVVKGGRLENDSDRESIIIDGAEYVLLDDMTIRGGKNCTHSILVKSGRGIRIRNCDIALWGREGVQNFQRLEGEQRFGAGNGSYVDRNGSPINLDPAIDIREDVSEVVVERCFIHDPVSRSVSWYYHHPEGPNAVLMGCPRHSTVLRYNDFVGSDSHLWNDAVEGLGNFEEHGGFNCDADIYGNFMIFANDDCIELDGGQKNVRCYGNRFEGALVGVSVQGCMAGPSYVFDNWFTGMGEEFGLYGQTVKTGGGVHGAASRSYIYDNVFWGDGFGIIERANLGTVVENNRFCGGQILRKNSDSSRSRDSGNEFGVEIAENAIDCSYPGRPLPFILDRARISVGLSREPVKVKILGSLPEGCVVRKPDACDWFEVSLDGKELTVTFDDAGMKRKRIYRGAFILRTPSGLSRPVSVYAGTSFVPPLRPQKEGSFIQYVDDFRMKSGERKTVNFTLERPGRYWIMIHGKAASSINNFELWKTRPHPLAGVDGEELERMSLHMYEYPAWNMMNPGGDLHSFVRHYDLSAGNHTIEIDATDDTNEYCFDDIAITDDPAVFEPNRNFSR